MTEIPGKALRRSLRLAALPASYGARVAAGVGRRIGGAPAEAVAAEVQRRTAEHIFATLGGLKGGAMKLGQALSAMEAMLPAELAGPYRDVLVRLQEAAPALPADAVRGVLARQLGGDWADGFRDFDDAPSAAASIGQVHRASRHDGTDVAVKVQYPGAAEALAADVRQLDRVVPLARLGAPAANVRDLFASLAERLVEELDYEHEAAVQDAFARAFADDPDVAVPRVVEAHRAVLVTEWLDGRPLSDVIARGDQPMRDHAAGLLLRFFLSSPARTGLIHGDPHPGNFRLLPDGRLGVLDFGSSEPVPGGWPLALGGLLAAGRDRDAHALHGATVAAGILPEDAVGPDQLLDLLDPWFEPTRAPRFHFERGWLQRHVRPWTDPRGRAAQLQRRVTMPPQHLLVQRVAFGLLGVVTSLDATVPVRDELEAHVPGFA